VPTAIEFMNLSTAFFAKHEKFFLEMTVNKYYREKGLKREDLPP